MQQSQRPALRAGALPSPGPIRLEAAMPQMRCKCQRILSYRVEQAGKVVKCPACSAPVQLPTASVAPTPEPPASAAAEREPEKAATELELQLEDNRPARASPGPCEPTPAAAPEEEYALSAAAPCAPAPPLTDTSTAAQAAPVGLSAEDSARVEGTFRQRLRGAFRYPLEEDGIVALAYGMMLIIVGHYVAYFASFLPIISLLVPVVIYAVLAGYFTGYATSVVKSSAQGEDAPPSLPQIGEYNEAILRPLFIVFTLGALTVGPYFLYQAWAPNPALWIGWMLLLPGLSYLPMGVPPHILGQRHQGPQPCAGRSRHQKGPAGLPLHLGARHVRGRAGGHRRMGDAELRARHRRALLRLCPAAGGRFLLALRRRAAHGAALLHLARSAELAGWISLSRRPIKAFCSVIRPTRCARRCDRNRAVLRSRSHRLNCLTWVA